MNRILLLITISFLGLTSVASTLSQDNGIVGDVNNSGKVDVTDAMLMVAHILGDYPGDDFSEVKADLNGDGKIDVVDVMLCVDIILNQSEEEVIPTPPVDDDGDANPYLPVLMPKATPEP